MSDETGLKDHAEDRADAKSVSFPPGTLAAKPPKPAMKPRLVVAQNVYHQIPGEQAYSTESRYSRWLSSDEQVYVRKIKVPADWVRLESGWVESPCALVISNDETAYKDVQPTEEQKAEVAGRVVELAVLVTNNPEGPRSMWSPPSDKGAQESLAVRFAVLRPGESMRFEPQPGAVYVARCLGASAKCQLVAVPS